MFEHTITIDVTTKNLASFSGVRFSSVKISALDDRFDRFISRNAVIVYVISCIGMSSRWRTLHALMAIDESSLLVAIVASILDGIHIILVVLIDLQSSKCKVPRVESLNGMLLQIGQAHFSFSHFIKQSECII